MHRGLLLLVCSCRDPSAENADMGNDVRSCSAFFGDREKEVEIVPGLRKGDGTFDELMDGGTVEFFRPPQLGHCLIIASRARNLCPDNVAIEVRAFDNDVFLDIDYRNSRLVPDGEWMATDLVNLSNSANVCLCPNGFAESLLDGEIRLVVTMMDLVESREATREVMVIPRCGQVVDECRALCECECGKGPVELGDCPIPKKEGLCELPDGGA